MSKIRVSRRRSSNLSDSNAYACTLPLLPRGEAGASSLRCNSQKPRLEERTVGPKAEFSFQNCASTDGHLELGSAVGGGSLRVHTPAQTRVGE